MKNLGVSLEEQLISVADSFQFVWTFDQTSDAFYSYLVQHKIKLNVALAMEEKEYEHA